MIKLLEIKPLDNVITEPSGEVVKEVDGGIDVETNQSLD